MPIESLLLRDKPVKFLRCPKCGDEPFEPFLRGQVQRTQHKYLGFGPRQDYCALICWKCKEVVGYESPPSNAPCWQPNIDWHVVWLALVIFAILAYTIYLFSLKPG
jgi:hypothetical protein